MKKLRLESLTADSFDTTAAGDGVRGTVGAHHAAVGTVLNCPYSYGGSCVISICLPCYTDAPCN